MDWYCWLSKTKLELSLIYEYGLAFTRNELKEDDITHFNHEFLQSMGISVAKHRLEILKLARKHETGRRSMTGFAKLVSAMAIAKTRKLFSKNIVHWSSPCKHAASQPMPLSELTPCRAQRSGMLMRRRAKDQNEYDKAAGGRSGPLPLERKVKKNRHLSVSGPLDTKVNERYTWNHYPEQARVASQKRSPLGCKGTTLSGPLRFSSATNEEKTGGGVYDEVQSVWSMMFKDMKPT